MKRSASVLKKIKAKNSKRGVSIVEAAVALLLITIISMAAADFLTRFAQVGTNNAYRAEARYATENALECFKFSEDQTQFGYFLITYAGFEQIEQEGVTEIGEAVYIRRTKGYEVTVRVIYGAESAEFSAIASETSGKEIVKIDKYERVLSGGAA